MCRWRTRPRARSSCMCGTRARARARAQGWWWYVVRAEDGGGRCGLVESPVQGERDEVVSVGDAREDDV